MILDRVLQWLSDRETIPNPFTIAMGELVREARKEANLSQVELAKKVYRRRATLSDIENGKTRIDAETLFLLAYNLNKPIHYFFPKQFIPLSEPGDLSIMEADLLAQARRLNEDDLQKLVAQASALADLADRKASDES